MFTITRGPKNLKGTFRAQKTLFFSLETSKQRKVFIFIIIFFLQNGFAPEVVFCRFTSGAQTLVDS